MARGAGSGVAGVFVFAFFEFFLVLVAAQVLYKVVGAAADGAEEVCYAPGSEDQEDKDDGQYLEEA